MDQYNLDAIVKLFKEKGTGPFMIEEIVEVLAPYDYDLTDGFTFDQPIDPPKTP
jgi:hypothetical protein